MKIFYLSFILFCFLSGCVSLSKYYGANVPKIVKNIGGGINYHETVKSKHATYIATNKNSFLRMIAKAKNGDVIYVSDDVKMNLSNQAPIKINGGVTIASGRGKSQGALFYSTNLKTYPLFVTMGNNVKFSGLRIKGPDSLRRAKELARLSKISKDAYYSVPISQGIKVQHSNIEIENCELWGWSHSAIFIRGKLASAHVHNSYIHHNQRHGLGYGICIDDGYSLVEKNIFDWNRHSISGTGRSNTSYEARFNIIKSHANGHAFDMHGGKDRKDKTNIAGKYISIHHNTFQLSSNKAIVVRGLPLEKSKIYNNIFEFQNEAKAILQTNDLGNIQIENNLFNSKSK